MRMLLTPLKARKPVVPAAARVRVASEAVPARERVAAPRAVPKEVIKVVPRVVLRAVLRAVRMALPKAVPKVVPKVVRMALLRAVPRGPRAAKDKATAARVGVEEVKASANLLPPTRRVTSREAVTSWALRCSVLHTYWH